MYLLPELFPGPVPHRFYHQRPDRMIGERSTQISKFKNMAHRPIILQVISMAELRRLRKQVAVMSVLSVVLVAFTFHRLASEEGNTVSIWATAALVLALLFNLILLYYRNQLDKGSNSLCVEDKLCYTGSGEAQRIRSFVQVHFGAESIRIGKDPGLSPTEVNQNIFRVLDRQDWKSLKERLNEVAFGHDNTHLHHPEPFTRKHIAV